MRSTMDTAGEDVAPAPLSRRGLLSGAGAAGVVAAATLAAPAADAADDGAEAKAYLPKVRPYRKTPNPDPATRHMANRFAYGYTPELRRQIHQAGGPQKWFERQLRPQHIPDARADQFDAWFPSRHRPPKISWANAEKGAATSGRPSATTLAGRCSAAPTRTASCSSG